MKREKLQMLGLSVNDLLSREQMKKVMGVSGSGSGGDSCNGSCNYQWTDTQGHTQTIYGTCKSSAADHLCYCSSGLGTC